MKRPVHLGYEIAEGQDIVNAMQNLAETHIVYLKLNRESGLYLLYKKKS